MYANTLFGSERYRTELIHILAFHFSFGLSVFKTRPKYIPYLAMLGTNANKLLRRVQECRYAGPNPLPTLLLRTFYFSYISSLHNEFESAHRLIECDI